MREPASVVARSVPLPARVVPPAPVGRRGSCVRLTTYGRFAQGMGNKLWPGARITSHFAYPKVEACLLLLRLSNRVPEPRLAGRFGTAPWLRQENSRKHQ